MNEPAPRAVSLINSGGAVRLALGPNFEAADVPDLLVAARAARDAGRPVVADCGGPDFLPVGAAQVLLALARACRAGGLPFTVEAVHEGAAAHLRRAGLDALLGP